MRRLLAIDSGRRHLGLAGFEGGRYAHGWCLDLQGWSVGELCSSASDEHTDTIDEIAIEVMRPQGTRPTTMVDLLDVQAVGFFVAGLYRPDRVHCYPATQWKANIPKEVHHERILAALSEEEREHLERDLEQCRKSNRKEIMDAVGIGLFHLGRINRSGSCVKSPPG